MKARPVEDRAEFFKLSEKANGVFGSEKWMSRYGPALQLVGLYKDEQQLAGGFFYLDTKKFGLRFLKLPPYTPHCGLFFESNSSNPAARNSARKEVMKEVCDYIIHLNPALTVLAFSSSHIDLQPFIWQNFKVIPNYTYQISLNKNLAEIQAGFDSKNRNSISKVLKENPKIDYNLESPDDLLQFFQKALGKSGANIYSSELSSIFTTFHKQQGAFHLSVRSGGELQAIVYCLYDQQSCYYLLGGTSRSAGISGLNNLLLLKAIEKAKDLNCERFDFEGSMLPGVEKFFRSFGPELIPFYTINKAWKPLEIVLKFKKSHIF